MFVHKSNPLALGFACTAAAMVMGLAAGPAQADRQEADQQNSYCSAPEVCNQRQIGIIQKTRDGVNYFYGGSAVAPPSVSYIYLIDNDQPVNQSINTSNLFATSFDAPHRFRMKKDHWKWIGSKPGPLDILGADTALDIPGADTALDIPDVGLGDKHTAP